jgi:hypothetical protein
LGTQVAVNEPIDNEAPVEDVLEQRRVAEDGELEEPLPEEVPDEVDDADYRDQQLEVPVEDEER